MSVRRRRRRRITKSPEERRRERWLAFRKVMFMVVLLAGCVLLSYQLTELLYGVRSEG